MKNYIFLITIAIFSLQSCGTTKNKVPATGDVEDQTLKTFISAYESNIPQFDYLQIKSKIDADVAGKKLNATLRLYIDTDDLIWANASMLGITGARANITPQKVQAYEVLDKTYVDSDFSFFNEKLKVNFLNFERLQQLLLGQLFLIEPWTSYELETTDENRYSLKYKQNQALQQNPQEGKYIHTFYLDSNYRLTQVSIFDKSTDTSITANYDGWHQIDGKNLPGKVKILVKSKETETITLEYNTFDFSQMNPPFRIPNGYEPIKLD